jgi:Uma2 family endonuclease
MTTRPSKPKSLPDPPLIRQLSEEEAPHLYEDGVYYPSAVNGPLLAPPSEADAPHLYENGVCYPSSDGVPLPDGETQGFAFQTLVTTLRAHYANQPRTRVNGNTFIYYDQTNPRRAVSPDCYVAFDVDVDVIDYHDNYRIWAMGKPPDFVLEIASQSTADNDLRPKRELYVYIGIGEYWRYDPTPDSKFYGEKLVGERQVNGEWERIPVETDAEGRPRGYSPILGLDLVWTEGILRFYDPANGEWVKNHEEEQAARAAAESMLAGESAARAAAEARAAELEAELRRLRGEAT